MNPTIDSLVAALEAAQNGLRWYQDMYPLAGSGADDEMHEQIDAAIEQARAEQAEPLFWYRPCCDGEMYEGPIHNVSIERVRKESGVWKPLYTHPPQPTQIDIEAMLTECVPGGSLCDPQQIADSIREWFTAHPPQPAQAVPDGWKLVPIEATRSMMAAAVIFANGNAVYKKVAAKALEIEESIYGEAFAAMIAAAPPPPPRCPSETSDSEEQAALSLKNEAQGAPPLPKGGA